MLHLHITNQTVVYRYLTIKCGFNKDDIQPLHHITYTNIIYYIYIYIYIYI